MSKNPMKFAALVLISIASVTLSGEVKGQTSPVDQATWDLLDGILKKKIPLQKILSVQEVRLTNLTIEPDQSKRTSVLGTPTTSQIFHAVNCTGRTQSWKRDIDYVTRTVTTVEMEKTVTTTETVQVEAGGSLFGVVDTKVTFTNEKQVKVNEKQTQVFTQEKTVRVAEQHSIPANTRLYVRVVEKSETTTFPLVGTGIVDAKVTFNYKDGGKSGPTWLSEYFLVPQPKDRTVSLEGLATIGTNETIDVIYEERPVSPGDPECNVVDPPDLKSFSR